MQKVSSYSKSAALGLLVILLFSNVTFTHSLDFHFCQGDLQSVAFFGKKSTCGKMIERQTNARNSCCDPKNDQSELGFTQKSCCDHVQVIQDNVYDKPGIDLNQTPSASVDFNDDFPKIDVKFTHVVAVLDKMEIPPPPIIPQQLSPEKLQVFII